MPEKVKEILQRMVEHGHSPDAQAQNLAELAAVVLADEKNHPTPLAPSEE